MDLVSITVVRRRQIRTPSSVSALITVVSRAPASPAGNEPHASPPGREAEAEQTRVMEMKPEPPELDGRLQQPGTLAHVLTP